LIPSQEKERERQRELWCGAHIDIMVWLASCNEHEGRKEEESKTVMVMIS